MDEPVIIERMQAALAAVDAAIADTLSPVELYQNVCDAIIQSSQIKGAAIILPVGNAELRYVAAAGRDSNMPSLANAPSISLDPEHHARRGSVDECFLTDGPVILNDYQTDPRVGEIWRAMGKHYGISAITSLPIRCKEKPTGVISFCFDFINPVTDPVLVLMTEMAAKIGLAMQHFEAAAERRKAERAQERLASLHAALSSTSQAILQASSADELFQSVSEAVAKANGNFGAAIFTQHDGQSWLQHRGSGGRDAEAIASLKLSLDPGAGHGHGLHGAAFHRQEVTISHDIAVDERTMSSIPAGVSFQNPGCAAAPLTVQDRPVGVILFFFGFLAPHHEPLFLDLIGQIAGNVSLKLATLAYDHPATSSTPSFRSAAVA